MGIIKLLPAEVAHKIAAGEVIERPASVVKELIENSIDADASQIEIEIKAGGIEYIRVQDNGIGISHDDLKLAFEPHATSKIESVTDLFSLFTLGFRGEALPSIASVSNFTLLTRTNDHQHGYKAEMKESNLHIVPVGMPTGTIGEVKNLFYNVPARYKFLKSASTERRQIVELVTAFAIAHPHIAFRLITDDKTVLATQGSGKLLDALILVHGKNIAGDLLPINTEFQWGTVRGYVGTPKLSRGNRKGQLFILNGRVIQNNTMRAALEKAYEGLLAKRSFPFAVIVVDIDPQLVDCNVHPAKSEVRFAQDQNLFTDILTAVREGIVTKNIAPKIQSPPKQDSIKTPNKMGNLPFKPEYRPELEWEPETWSYLDAVLQEYNPHSSVQEHWEEDIQVSENNQDIVPSNNVEEVPVAVGLETTDDVRSQLLSGRIIGQLHQTYVLLEVETGLWLLDQHIIHERILFERIMKSYANDQIHIQEILPQLLEYGPREGALVNENIEQLKKYGIELEEFGANSYLLRAVPSFLSKSSGDWGKDVLEIIDSIRQGDSGREQSAITLACRGAVKAGDYLDHQTIKRLLAELTQTENPFTCPHGRPIIVRLERDEILRRFGRT